MGIKRPAPGGRKKARKHAPRITVDEDLRIPAQALLATIRRTKQSLADETDPEESSRLRRLLSRTYRKVRAFREALEAITPEAPRRARSALAEQIQLLLLLEDEFVRDEGGTRPV